jgi:hypothetical protein
MANRTKRCTRSKSGNKRGNMLYLITLIAVVGSVDAKSGIA